MDPGDSTPVAGTAGTALAGRPPPTL